MRLLLQTEVKWLPESNYLIRFVSLFEIISFSENKGDRFSKGDKQTQKIAYVLWFEFFRKVNISIISTSDEIIYYINMQI